MEYLTPITPQICDTDFSGNVNHVAYQRWFDHARISFYAQLFPKMQTIPHGLVTLKSTVEYYRFVNVLDTLVIHSRVTHIGTKSFELTQELRRGEELCAKSVMVFCALDFNLHKSEPLDDFKRNVLQKFL
ncbi:MAG: thioesterase family protein [Planctomycetia bacterium]|nr:thioesterase family protein [Planctomycetia bacterium]